MLPVQQFSFHTMKFLRVSLFLLGLFYQNFLLAQFTVVQTGGTENTTTCPAANAMCINACENSNLVLTVTYTGPNAGDLVSYRWREEFTNLAETSNTLTINNFNPSTSSVTYRVNALDAMGNNVTGSSSSSIEISLTEAPHNLGIEVSSFSVCNSPPQSITLMATGEGDITEYEWFRGNTSLGPPSASNTINVMTDGDYSFNAIGCTTVRSPFLTVSTVSTPPMNLSIVAEDALDPTNVCFSGTARLNSTVDNAAGVAYQWYFNDLSTPIADATNSFYDVSGASPGTYILVATNGCGSDQDNFTISSQFSPIGVTLNQFGGPVACADPPSSPITLTASVASPNGTITQYDWFKEGVLYAQTNGSENTLLLSEAGTYTVTAYNKCGASVVSNSVNAVVVQPPTEPKLEGFPTPSIGCGQSEVLLLRSSNGNPSSFIEYRWYRDGTEFANPSNSYNTNIPGTYVIEAFTNNGCGGTFSDTLVVEEVFDAPTFINLKTESNISCGTSALLTAQTDARGVTYEWFKNNVLFTTTKSPILEVTESANYKVRAINACGSTSFSAELPINILVSFLTQPTISLPDGTNTICEGESIHLQANNTGSGSVSYQWFRNNELLIGATSDNIEIEEAGNYTVQVSDGLCSKISSVQDVFLDGVANVELLFSGSLEFCEGDSVVIFARSTDTGLLYEWLKNGEDTVGVGNSFTARDPGAYVITLRTTNICGGIQELNIDLVVTPEASRPITSNGIALIIEENSDFYQWRKNGFPIVGANSSAYVPVDTGSYSVVLTNVLGCSRVTDEYQVNILPTSEELLITPNPADEQFEVLLLTEKEVVIRITDTQGRVYLEDSLPEVNEETRFATIDVSDFNTGVYIVWVEGEGYLASEKLIVR